MVSCCSSGLAVRRAAAWSYVLGVKEDDYSQASSFTPSTQDNAAALLTANPLLQQDTIPHALICSLTLLMMDKCLSETC
jgi:hypothetical protein